MQITLPPSLCNGARSRLPAQSLIVACATIALLAACGQVPVTPREPPPAPESLVWPKPPAPARIRFVKSVETPADWGALRWGLPALHGQGDRPDAVPLRPADERGRARERAVRRRPGRAGAGDPRPGRRARAQDHPRRAGQPGVAGRGGARTAEQAVPGRQRAAQDLRRRWAGAAAVDHRRRGTAGAPGRRRLRRDERSTVRRRRRGPSHLRLRGGRASHRVVRQQRRRAGRVQLSDASRADAQTGTCSSPTRSITACRSCAATASRSPRSATSATDRGISPRPRASARTATATSTSSTRCSTRCRSSPATARCCWASASAARVAGRFWLPNGLFIDAKDAIYVADSYNQRISVFERAMPAGKDGDDSAK